jgi:hypothetical protein
MGCSFSSCTTPGTCGNNIFQGTCTPGCTATGNLCC